MKPSVLLFDFFGTLVQYNPDRAEIDYSASHQWLVRHLSQTSQSTSKISYQRYFEAWQQAFELTEAEPRAGREFLMTEVAVHCEHLLELRLLPAAIDQWVDAYMSDWSSDIVLMTGVRGLLSRLKTHYRLGLVSNTHHAPTVHRLLETFGLQPLFESVVLSAEWGYAKPHDSIFRESLRRMECASGAAVYIGDSFDADYRGGQAAGLQSYLIGRHARVPRDRQLRNIQDLAIYFDTAVKQR